MAFTFVILFPLGALLIRLASFKSLVWVHAAVQGFGYISAFTGLALGIYIAMVPTFKVRPRSLASPNRARGFANISTAQLLPSYHWHRCGLTTRISTSYWPTTSSPVQDLLQPDWMVYTTCVARTFSYHAWYH